MKKLTLFALSLAFVPVAHAQTCNAGSLNGTYGFVASRQPFVGVPINSAPSALTVSGVPFLPPGTISTSKRVPVSALIQGAKNNAIFGTVGTIFADGISALYASSDTSGQIAAQVGTYSVREDCSVSFTINDVFSEATVSPGTGATFASATFQGFLVDNGNGVDLLQTGATFPVPLTLTKTVQNNSCTIANLSGAFGFLIQGETFADQSTAAGGGSSFTATPFNAMGRIFADAAGGLIQDPLSAASRRFTGTYTVNPDCTGTARLVDNKGAARNIAFVIVNSVGTGGVGVGATSPQLFFAVTDGSVVSTGIAKQQ